MVFFCVLRGIVQKHERVKWAFRSIGVCKIKVLYFLKTNTYEIEFWSNFEGFSKAKIAFERVGRVRKERKMRSECHSALPFWIFGPHAVRKFTACD